MADERNKNKNRNVDDAGIRLAPTPIRNSDYHVLPSIRQEFVIEPTMHIDEPKDEMKTEYSTADDFQPKVKDKSKKWKRTKRGKNIVFGFIMLAVTIVVVLPYILSVAGTRPSLPFKYVPEELNAIGGIEADMTNTPIEFTFDFRPGYAMLFANGGAIHGLDWSIVLAVRYTF